LLLVLDTHVAVWWAGEPRRLGRAARARLAAAERLGIPAIVFWEVALLVRKRKLDLGMSVSAWAQAIQTVPRVEALPLTAEIAVQADELEMHQDPADRFIVATALRHAAPLVSKDALMRSLRFVETIW
jgi:PIN domain nuclease of toxin-antitoxin system